VKKLKTTTFSSFVTSDDQNKAHAGLYVARCTPKTYAPYMDMVLQYMIEP